MSTEQALSDEAPVKRRKPSALSPTKRALAELKKRGWPAAIVERWNQFAMVRQDLFGVFDLLALRPEAVGEPLASLSNYGLEPAAILGIQVTTASNRAARRDKLLASPYLAPWCACGGVVELWCYSKKGARGKRKLWELTVERVEPGAK